MSSISTVNIVAVANMLIDKWKRMGDSYAELAIREEAKIHGITEFITLVQEEVARGEQDSIPSTAEEETPRG